jgi:hypothetical protein
MGKGRRPYPSKLYPSYLTKPGLLALVFRRLFQTLPDLATQGRRPRHLDIRPVAQHIHHQLAVITIWKLQEIEAILRNVQMVPFGTDQNGTYLRQITSRLRLLIIPAQAGIPGTKPPTVQLDPGLRRDDGGFGLSKCHSGQTTIKWPAHSVLLTEFYRSSGITRVRYQFSIILAETRI